jgi:hypothetical protein
MLCFIERVIFKKEKVTQKHLDYLTEVLGDYC